MRALTFRALTSRALQRAALIPATAALGLCAVTVAAAVSGATAAQAAPGSGVPGCHYTFVPPDSWQLQCSNGGGTPGGPGSGGSGGGSQKYACKLTPISAAQVRYLGLPPAPKGERWEAISCPGPSPFGGVTLVSKNGTPEVTPQELLQVAMGELKVPTLRPGTAPPLGRDGLVGLPEWFWIPRAEWHAVSVTVRAGPVWAEAVATPEQLTFYPGGGLAGASCAGPGAPYRARSAAGSCWYTYAQSSALQPGHAYQASVTVTWRVTWFGSGGTGGVVDAGLRVGYPFALRVAEAQALVTGR
jgi:hypothetical protein